MSVKKKAGYVTLRLEVQKSVLVTTVGTVDVQIPRAHRPRIRNGKMKPSKFAEFLNDFNCIEWREGKSGYSTERVMGVEQLPESEHAHRCCWNAHTKAWVFEEAESAGDED